ncbi:hypothetical protein MPNT_80048 [Candidatus Methylacidithermus pantelleriae]|uniref:Uncharacterized protein n=1 Tax=Candidatus Methylacidithermus pantelleriae TaxID=2744239 RepID=A0A8J2BST8_9BACT|nr:hypothetical protein MPNT_80048 [Candidatus Methylacidithermus pantelleriae]
MRKIADDRPNLPFLLSVPPFSALTGTELPRPRHHPPQPSPVFAASAESLLFDLERYLCISSRHHAVGSRRFSRQMG